MQIQCKLIKESREWPYCEPVLQILPWNSMPFFRSFDYQRGKNTWTRGNPNLLQLCKGFSGAPAWSLTAVVVNSDPVVSHGLGQGYASVPVKPWAHLLAVPHGLPEEGGLQTVAQDRHHLGGSIPKPGRNDTYPTGLSWGLKVINYIMQFTLRLYIVSLTLPRHLVSVEVLTKDWLL